MNTVAGYTNSTRAITHSNIEAINTDNLCDTDYENNASFKTTPKTLCSLKIGSPTLTELGVPNDAIITNVKLTDVSYRYVNTYYTPTTNRMGIEIDGVEYDVQSMNRVLEYATYIYDTGTVEINKGAFENDRAYFFFEWMSEGASTYQPKTLYWEITYNVGSSTSRIKVGGNSIAKLYVGSNEVIAVYKGDVKL